MEQAYELLGTYTADQWGLVTARQAKSVGVDAVTLHRLTSARFLEGVRRGVYAAISSAASPARDEQAVWLAFNPEVAGWARPTLDPHGGVVSHQSAARLHGLGELVNDRIAFTVPKRRDVRDPDVWTKAAELAEDDVVVLDGLPVTSVVRTVCDLLDQHIDGSHVATIIREGVQAGKLQIDDVAERIAPYARRYGVAPYDGEALLELLLDQIGLTVSALTVRPTSPRVSATIAEVVRGWSTDLAVAAGSLAAVQNSALQDLAVAGRGLAAVQNSALQDLAATAGPLRVVQNSALLEAAGGIGSAAAVAAVMSFYGTKDLDSALSPFAQVVRSSAPALAVTTAVPLSSWSPPAGLFPALTAELTRALSAEQGNELAASWEESARRDTNVAGADDDAQA